MHAAQLAEIANWAAFNADTLIAQPSAITAEKCSQYWSQSKCRQNRWMIALKIFEQDVESDDCTHDPWPAIEIVVQEIFLSEMLTRVWSAAMVAHDREHNVNELTGVAHSVHIGHMEAKNRGMRLLLCENAINPELFERLNALRRKVERWTDLLLGQLEDNMAASQFGFQPKRVRDFYQEFSEGSRQDNQTRRFIYAASLAEDLREMTVGFPANPKINAQIAGGLMACFPADRFDSLGLPKSAQMLWMEKSSLEAQMLLDDLESLETSSMSFLDR